MKHAHWKMVYSNMYETILKNSKTFSGWKQEYIDWTGEL